MSAGTPPAAVLRVERVSKTFPARFGRPEVQAVREVSFSVAPGEILGLLGPNGAGKTTTIKMVAGLLRPSAGAVHIGPHDVAQARSKATRRLGAVLEGNRNLHWKLTAMENLRYFGALKGVKDLNRRAEAVVTRLGLDEHRQKRVGELSRGLQQRVAIAIALLNEPQVLLLDEPTLGLDVIAASEFKQIVKDVARDGCGIILTTHQMEVAQELSDRVAVIAKGRLAVSESLSGLLAAYRTPGYELRVRGPLTPQTRQAITALGALAASDDDQHHRITLGEDARDTLYTLIAQLRDCDAELVSVQQQEPNLEEIYRRVLGEAP